MVLATTADAALAQSLSQEPNVVQQPLDEQLRRWEAIEGSKVRCRRVAGSIDGSAHQLWSLPIPRHATCAAHWVFGRFPASKEAVQWFLREATYIHWDLTLREAFTKPVWAQTDAEAVVEALEKMSDYWAWPLRFRRLQYSRG